MYTKTFFRQIGATMSGDRVDFKIVVLGSENCGKTSLVEKFIFNKSVTEEYQNTIGAAFGAKSIFVLGRKINIGIWDTSGSERYEPISKLYYKTAQAQCGNFMIFASFIFYVKSKLRIFEVQKLPFYHI